MDYLVSCSNHHPWRLPPLGYIKLQLTWSSAGNRPLWVGGQTRDCQRSSQNFCGSLTPTQTQFLGWKSILPYAHMGEISWLSCLHPYHCPPSPTLGWYHLTFILCHVKFGLWLPLGQRLIWWQLSVASTIYCLESFLLVRFLKHPCLLEISRPAYLS